MSLLEPFLEVRLFPLIEVERGDAIEGSAMLVIHLFFFLLFLYFNDYKNILLDDVYLSLALLSGFYGRVGP
jgi:predicted membrane-bound dolichyl-phosphate-mannose-protein mannosyltransferase